MFILVMAMPEAAQPFINKAIHTPAAIIHVRPLSAVRPASGPV